jgi:hypothetical protein
MTGNLWGDDPDRDLLHQPHWTNKIVLSICWAIIIFGVWYFGWLSATWGVLSRLIQGLRQCI